MNRQMMNNLGCVRFANTVQKSEPEPATEMEALREENSTLQHGLNVLLKQLATKDDSTTTAQDNEPEPIAPITKADKEQALIHKLEYRNAHSLRMSGFRLT